MFSSLDRTKPKTISAPIGASLALHAIALLLIAFYHPRPVFVTPSSIAMGNGDKSFRLVYFAEPGAENQPEPLEHKAFLAHAFRRSTVRKKPQLLAQQQANVGRKADEANKEARAGSEYGALFNGPAEGHDVRPAYPVIFPDPPVSRSDFPSGFQGDVVVEVSIDKLGNVIDLRLLQGVGRGIDEKILATLRNWRYKPATMDGEPIAEKHDVHFHFPG